MSKSAHLVVFGSGIAVVITVILLTSHWMSTAATVGIALLAATTASSLIEDRIRRRGMVWIRALGQGALAGTVAWLVLRWLTS